MHESVNARTSVRVYMYISIYKGTGVHLTTCIHVYLIRVYLISLDVGYAWYKHR